MNKEMDIQGVTELDLRQLLAMLLRRWRFIGLVVVLSGILGFLISYSLISYVYRSSTMFYANITIQTGITSREETPDTEQTDEEDQKLSSVIISASRTLVDSYRVILHTDETLRQIAQVSGVDRSPDRLRNMVQLVSVGGTEVFQVTVSGNNAREVYLLAQATSQVLPQRVMDIVENTRVQVVEAPILPQGPSAPNHTLNGLIGAYAGFLLAVTVVILLELLRIRIHREEDIASCTDVPVLVTIPDMHASGRDTYYGYVSRLRSFHGKGNKTLVGGGASFEASEAYKLLRTKLGLTRRDPADCLVLGITSVGNSEGKSLTATNLAYALSQLSKRVLLIDGDLRRTTVGVKLAVKKQPGLSDWLCGHCSLQQLLQPCGLREDNNAFQVISAGSMAPNPAELLSSKRFSSLLEQMREQFDYIVMDLPSAGIFSDALVVSDRLDGMLLVVRQGVCRGRKLQALIGQLQYMNRKVVGIVYNCATQRNKRCGAKGYFARSKRSYRGNYMIKK